MGRNLHAQINAPPTSAHTPTPISDAPARVRCVLAFALNVGAGVGAGVDAEMVGDGVCVADAALETIVGVPVGAGVGIDDGATVEALVGV